MRVIIGLLLALSGLWVGAVTFAQTNYRRDPQRAATLDPRSGLVLAKQARALMEQGSFRDARHSARSALARDATAVGAVQIMGITAQTAGDLDQAGRWLAYAKRLSRRELQTNLWAIEYHVLRGDTGRVLANYDLALRTSAQARDTLYPVLGGAIGETDVARGLLGVLRRRPLWSADFLSFIASDNRVPPDVATNFLTRAHGNGLNIPAAGLQVLVSRSLQAQAVETAWRAYRIKRPEAPRRRVRDPGFAALPETPTLFDWTLAEDGSILAQTDNVDGRGKLNVNAGTGAAGLAAQQAQALPQGSYRLTVTTDEVALSDGSLTWTVSCGDGRELAKLAMARSSARRNAATSFRIPAECPFQLLKLDVFAGDSLDGVRAVITGVAIDPTP
jgi:tetratricopeptide (TPR) repeat protein